MGGTVSASAVFGLPVSGPVLDPFAGQTAFGFEIPQGSVSGLEDEARQAGLVSLSFDFRAQDMRTAARAATGRWQGQAQSAFLDYAAHLIAVFENNSGVTGCAGRLLLTLSSELEVAQKATRQAALECEACQKQHDTQQELAQQHARNASDLHAQAALAPHPHAQADLTRQAQTAEADSQTAARAAQAAADELSSWQKRGQNAYGNYIDVAGRIGRELSALTDQLQRPSLPRGVPAGLLPISAADAKRAQTLLSKAAAIPAAKWREHPGEALREINHGKGMTPNQILALYQAEKAQAGKPKGDLGDTYGGELSGIVGFHLFGNTRTSDYQTAEGVAALASFIPATPEGLGKDVIEGTAKLGEKLLPKIAEDELASISDLGLEKSQAQEVRTTVSRIQSDGPYPYDQDGTVFRNREGLLPEEPAGYYKEYTVATPGAANRGVLRIVVGKGGEYYYTPDHYGSFQQFNPGS